MTKTTMAWICGIGVGAGAMLLLDPARGRRRRALLRDKMRRSRHRAGAALAAASRGVGNRLAGTWAEVLHHRRRREADDDVIVARVRARLGHHTSRSSAVEVKCQDGHVVLDGPILRHEVSGLLRAVQHVPGVRGIDNRLHAQSTPGFRRFA